MGTVVKIGLSKSPWKFSLTTFHFVQARQDKFAHQLYTITGVQIMLTLVHLNEMNLFYNSLTAYFF